MHLTEMLPCRTGKMRSATECNFFSTIAYVYHCHVSGIKIPGVFSIHIRRRCDVPDENQEYCYGMDRSLT